MIKYRLRSSSHLREFLLAPLNIGTPLKRGKSMMRRHKTEPVKIGLPSKRRRCYLNIYDKISNLTVRPFL